MSLHACASCRRHVRDDEDACPFCGAAVVAPSAPRAAIVGRLARGGAVLLGGLGLAMIACESHHPMPTMYGAPPSPSPSVRVRVEGDIAYASDLARKNAVARGCEVHDAGKGFQAHCEELELLVFPDQGSLQIECTGSRDRCQTLVDALRAEVSDAGVTDAAPSD